MESNPKCAGCDKESTYTIWISNTEIFLCDKHDIKVDFKRHEYSVIDKECPKN